MLILRLFSDGYYEIQDNDIVTSEGHWNSDTEQDLIKEIKQRASESNKKFYTSYFKED